MLDKRKMLKQIRQRWNSPEKLLEYISDLDKQQGLEIELAYKRGMKETIRNYSILFGVRIDIWTHFMRGCIIDYVH